MKPCDYRITRNVKCCGGAVKQHITCRVTGFQVEEKVCDKCGSDPQQIIDLTCLERGEVFRRVFDKRLTKASTKPSGRFDK